MNKLTIGIGVAVIIAIGLFMFGGNPGSTNGNVVSAGEVIEIPLADISSQATWHQSQGSKFFVVEASNGDIKVAFDACDVCGGSKGYRQEGEDMICNNCGRHFAIDELGSKNIYGGGCWPGHLDHTIENGNVVIKTSDISKGSYKF